MDFKTFSGVCAPADPDNTLVSTIRPINTLIKSYHLRGRKRRRKEGAIGRESGSIRLP